MEASSINDDLKPLIKVAIEKAFADITQELNKIDEEIYLFVLYTTNSYSRTLPVYNTEESLERTAQRYINEFGYSDVRVDEMKISLRWSCGDWQYRSYSNEYFIELNELLHAIYLESRALEESLEFDKADSIHQAIRNLIHESLHDLNSNGFFGLGEDRGKLTVFVELGDGDTDELRESIKLCNPSEVFEKYKDQMEIAYHLANF